MVLSSGAFIDRLCLFRRLFRTQSTKRDGWGVVRNRTDRRDLVARSCQRPAHYHGNHLGVTAYTVLTGTAAYLRFLYRERRGRAQRHKGE